MGVLVELIRCLQTLLEAVVGAAAAVAPCQWTAAVGNGFHLAEQLTYVAPVWNTLRWSTKA